MSRDLQVYRRLSTWTAAIGAVITATSAYATSVSTTSDPNTLVNAILGSGVTIVAGTPTFSGAAGAAGTFSGANSIPLGFDSGIILTSGDATIANGSANTVTDAGADNGAPGYTPLEALSGNTSFNAAVLSFDFKLNSPGTLYFNYVFASEEYNEYVNQFNDVFAFFLDGTAQANDIALLPDGTPVDINNVNNNVNPSQYRPNRFGDTAPGIDGIAGSLLTEYDGLTKVLTATAHINDTGSHHIDLAISDTRDAILDSAVFIQAGTFADQPTPGGSVPDGGSTALLASLAALGLGCLRKGFATHATRR